MCDIEWYITITRYKLEQLTKQDALQTRHMQPGEMDHRDAETGWNDGLPNHQEDAYLCADCKQSSATVPGKR